MRVHPFPLMQFVLGAPLSTRNRWKVIYLQVVTQGLLEGCVPLLNFIIIACFKCNNVNKEPVTLLEHLGLGGYNISPEVANHCHSNVLHKHLPSLVVRPLQTSNPALIQLVT